MYVLLPIRFVNKPYYNSTSGLPSVQKSAMWDSSSVSNGVLAVVWIGTAGNLKTSVVSLFSSTDTSVLTFVTLRNMGPNNISTIDYMRNINPNQDQVGVYLS